MTVVATSTAFTPLQQALLDKIAAQRAPLTPATVHWGLDGQLTAQRQQVLQAAFAAHSERFVKGLPQPPRMPDAVWINPPLPDNTPLMAETATQTEAIPAVTGESSGAQVVSRVGGFLPTRAALDAPGHRDRIARRWDCRNDTLAYP